MSVDEDVQFDPKFAAAIDYIWRVTPNPLDVRFRLDKSEVPAVWIVVAEYADNAYVVEGDIHYLRAVTKLCDHLTRGGRCLHCGRYAMFDPETLDLPTDGAVCWIQYDPELCVYRRSCEGDDVVAQIDALAR